MKQPKLTLVGAGPGDPELITLRGLRKIKEADVILYDDLVHLDLLLHAKEGALKICVGKRCGNHYTTQEQINDLIVTHALQYGHVVRLKGGDPFVFGRGYEEIEYASAFGIETDVVPGLSSSISLTGLQQIPLTHRGVSESFWVITGTTSTHDLSKDILLAAKSKATIVILMGVNKLKQIANIFLAEGKRDLPVALIQNGSLENEKIIIGAIKNIVRIAEEEQFDTPGIIVIGEVVNTNRANLVQELISNVPDSIHSESISNVRHSQFSMLNSQLL